jgi:hypothetical protein
MGRVSRALLDTAVDASRGYPELKKRNPELYRKITDRQNAVAACRERAARNRKLLDMRLD